ncbi:MAG: isoprenoid biosynthesis glyoxalase ElbB [Bradyrhizobiaceae bacterium]|nr:isoprenoid biosynthesis glyoxalase ElbB [Bradyrhizobiaceae bacterium]
MYNVGVLLSGCGVYDGSEIHEAVFTLLELAKHGVRTTCMAPDANQLHVVNHLTGQVADEQRNILVESARIARGMIESLADVDVASLDALVIPGGFGTAKNHTTWALHGSECEIRTDVAELIRQMADAGKPIVGLCMGPTTIAKALASTLHHAELTVGTPDEATPYNITEISKGMEILGAKAKYCTVREVAVDAKQRIITAPAYMMEASIVDVHNNIAQAISALMSMLGER